MPEPHTSHKAMNLRCEYLTDPIGVDVQAPRLSWIFDAPSTIRGAAQSAYQIIAAASCDQLDSESDLLWDSGKVASDQCCQIKYGGGQLACGQRVWWKLRLWDQNDMPSDWSEASFWEMGLLEKSNWNAKWIGPEGRDDIYVSYPTPILRREVSLKDSIAAARIYITARGLYSARINGQQITCDELTPGWTDYNKRVAYNTYDVTELLSSGENTLAVTLADGWYCGNLNGFGIDHRGRYGKDPQLLMQLVVTYADGSSETICSDENWRWTNGPYTTADIYKGEHYDANNECTGWEKNGYDDSEWSPVKLYDDNDAVMVAKSVEPVRVIEKIKPIAISNIAEKTWIFDMGQNMVGRARIKFKAAAGQKITMRHAEVLNEDGTLYVTNLRSAVQTDSFTAAIDGEYEFAPIFTFHGFRYFEVSGLDAAPALEDVIGEVMHNAMPHTGSFECSVSDLNQLQHNITWGQKGNYLEVPTDCPQRDERLGWTGDAQVFIRTGAFNFDVAAFFTKWLDDLEDSQFDDGNIPFVSPDTLSRPGKPPAAGAAAWGDAAVICPWAIYLCYGDIAVLEKHYDMMAGWIRFQKQTSKNLLRPKNGFGDWLAMDAPGRDSAQTATPKDLVGTAYFAYTSRIMARVAELLGKTGDAKTYAKLTDDVIAAFRNEYITPGGRIMGDTQTSYSMAINMDLLDESMVAQAAERLASDIEDHKDHITTGFVGVNQIMFALTQTGKIEHNYRLLFQDTYPSWLMPVKNGATTIWERWDGWTPDNGFQNPGMNSFNHYAYGCVGEWLYRCCAGLDLDENRPGYKHLRICPNPDPTGQMTWAKASLESVNGHVESGWKIENGKLTVDAVVAPNTTATVILKAASADAITESGSALCDAEGVSKVTSHGDMIEIEITSGTYSFTVKQ